MQFGTIEKRPTFEQYWRRLRARPEAMPEMGPELARVARFRGLSERFMIQSISAITLSTIDMRRAVQFYRMLGFRLAYGGEEADFSSFFAGLNFLNLIAQQAPLRRAWWGRVIIYESDVDALYSRLIAAGYRPRDAEWGERFFHLADPDGHELSFAWPLASAQKSPNG